MGSIALILEELDERKWKKKYPCKEDGTMKAALLAYKRLAKLLTGWSFIMNV